MLVSFSLQPREHRRGLLHTMATVTLTLLLLLVDDASAQAPQQPKQHQREPYNFRSLLSNQDDGMRSLFSTDGSNVVQPQFDFVLADSFFDKKCDPCIARDTYVIHVLIHTQAAQFGDHDSLENSQEEDNTYEHIKYWAQVQSAMEQASRDFKVRLEFLYFNHTTSGGSMGATDAMTMHLLQLAQLAALPLASRTMHNSDLTTANDQYFDSTTLPQQIPNALIVGLPHATTTLNNGINNDHTQSISRAVVDVLKAGIPVFGFGAGYAQAAQSKVLGFVAQDEYVAGEVVAQNLIRHDAIFNLTNATTMESDYDDTEDEEDENGGPNVISTQSFVCRKCTGSGL